MNKEELVEKCLESMKSSLRPPTEVAREVLSGMWSSMGDELKQDLAVAGLGHMTAYRYSAQRSPPRPSPKQKEEIAQATKRMGQRIGKSISDHASDVLRSISFVVNGKLRSLFDFTAESVTAFSTEARSNERAWSARVAWCKKASDALARSGAKTLGELPVRLRNEVARSTEKTWSRNAGASLSLKGGRRAA